MKTTTDNPVGRPPMYKTAAEMQVKIDEYFENNQYYNTVDLAVHLGFRDKQSLYDYRKKPEFSYSIERAILRIEGYQCRCLQNGNVAGAKFTLINNFGWKEKVETTNIDKACITERPVDEMTDQELKEEKERIEKKMKENHEKPL